MKKFENIVLSDTEPSIQSIWLKNGKLHYFNNGTWNEIVTAIETQPEEVPEEPAEPEVQNINTDEE